MQSTIGITLVIALGIVMLVVGFVTAKMNKTSEDYYVGGRRLGWLVTICTQCATFVGGGMTLGWIGMGFFRGLGAAWWGIPQSFGFFFMAVVMVKQMRASGTSFISLPDWFDSIYGNKTLNIISTIACLIVPFTWVTAQTTAAARMLEGIGVPFIWGVILVGGVVITYTTVGGYLAVVYTDTIQWLLLFTLFCLTVPSAFVIAGGFHKIMATTPVFMHNFFYIDKMPPYTIFLWIIAGLVSGMGLQSSYQRIYSARTTEIAKGGLIATGIATVFFAVITAFAGMAVFSLGGAPAGLKSDGVWPWFLSKYLPSWVAIVYTVLIMMATMSTADSMLNSISMSITHDLYQKYINPSAPEKKVMRIGVWVTGIFGVVALYWATAGSWMIKLFGFSYTVGAGPLSAAVISAALFKKRIAPKFLALGILCGAVVGYITTIVPGFSEIPAGGTVFSFGSALIISLLGIAFGSNNTAAVKN